MAGTSGNRKRKTNNRKRKNDDIYMSPEVKMIITVAIGIFLFLCNIHMIGDVGNVVAQGMFGLFGFPAYVVPVLLVVAVYFYLKSQTDKKYGGALRIKIWSGSVFFLFLCVLFDLFGGISGSLMEYDVAMIWSECAQKRSGGGVIAGSLCYVMNKYLDMAGTILVALLVLIITLIVITGRQFIDAVKEGSSKAFYSAKDDAANYMEQAAVRKKERVTQKCEEQLPRYAKIKRGVDNDMLDDVVDGDELTEKKIPRRERKVSGVMDDTNLKKTKKSTFERDDIHEITVDDIEQEKEYSSVSAINEHPFDKMQEIKFHGIENDIEPDNGESINAKSKKEVAKDADNGFAGRNVTFNKADVGSQTDVYDTKDEISHNGSKAYTNVGNTQSVSLKKYKAPTIDLLTKTKNASSKESQAELTQKAVELENALKTFGVDAEVTDISQGPSVTRFELKPKAGVRVSKIVSLTDDIKLSLAAADIRIEAPIPGKQAVGIEVPNKESTGVSLRELFEDKEFKNFDSKIAFAVGKDITGKVVVTDIAKMPHMLIAGATGSGKSVCINTIIMSILYKARPDEVKLIMIDPKVVELSVYNGIPHLMIPVVTDPKKAAAALNWGVAEMTDRYQKFAQMNVRDLKGYNKAVEALKAKNEGEDLCILPQIVIIVDELADLMMVAAKEVEESICRLAQLARACGIHLIIATQRPSVDVITGLIKANMPSRVAFAVSSGVDSRTILDMNGAERLLGKGDMLFYPQGYPKPARMQGAFVSDADVSRVVEYLKAQNIIIDSNEDILSKMSASGNGGSIGAGDGADDKDELFVLAAKFIIEQEKASIGSLQRKFKIGFNRAARIMDQLSEAGVVGPEVGTKPREILMGPEQFEEYIEEYL
ncbi:MAG: DNA translocase FtsK [Lachnospiraceae bacterium]|nr:DNA translocase FtsK [Candidatus Colinaster equi]